MIYWDKSKPQTYLKPCQTLDRDIWLISRNVPIRRKHWPLLSRWSWRFSSNRDENTSLCLTSSSISSSFSSESGICYSKTKIKTQSIICALQGQHRKFALKAGVISYLNFLLLLIQPIRYIDFQPFPEIEPICLQARSSLQPFLRETPWRFYHIYTLFSRRWPYPEQDTANGMLKIKIQ